LAKDKPSVKKQEEIANIENIKRRIDMLDRRLDDIDSMVSAVIENRKRPKRMFYSMPTNLTPLGPSASPVRFFLPGKWVPGFTTVIPE